MLRTLLVLGGLARRAAHARPVVRRRRGAAAPRGDHRVVGHGTPASCTAAAFRKAVAQGGTITFDCGPDPVTIVMDKHREVHNDAAPQGRHRRRRAGHAQRRRQAPDPLPEHLRPAADLDHVALPGPGHPKLVLRHLTFTRGNSTGSLEEGGGGGAVFVRGGRLSVVDTTFTRNRCDKTGPDLGGAAIRVLDQFRDQPVKVTGSTFTGGRCSNGGALSSIGVSWVVTDSVFRGNKAIGRGANPAQPGTPGGGSGGAHLHRRQPVHVRAASAPTMEGNVAREGGGAIFFVSNDRTGTLVDPGLDAARQPEPGLRELPGHLLPRPAASPRSPARPSTEVRIGP